MKHPNETLKGKGGAYANTPAFVFLEIAFDIPLRTRLTKLGEHTKIGRKFESDRTRKPILLEKQDLRLLSQVPHHLVLMCLPVQRTKSKGVRP